jgi:hypothetical protein
MDAYRAVSYLNLSELGVIEIQSVRSFNPFTGGTTIDGSNFFSHFATHFDLDINSLRNQATQAKQSNNPYYKLPFLPTIQVSFTAFIRKKQKGIFVTIHYKA